MSAFLKAAWKNLIMANYIVDPAILKPYLPAKTEIDLFNGKAYVSLVAFMFLDTRILGIKVPFHVNFEEVNLRFYVRHNHNGQWKRGTVFIKEIVPKPAISVIANTLYHEKYVTKRMRHDLRETATELKLGYHWKHKRVWNTVEAVVQNQPLPMLEGSEESFIAEHYWGYSKYNEHTTFEYNVQHPAWNAFPLISYGIDCDFKGLYGSAFAHLQDGKPNSVLVAEGSPVSIMKKRKL